MSVAALTWAFHIPMTDASAKAVLVALADHADANGYCFPSIERLVMFTALADRTIHAALGRLETMGAVRVARKAGTKNHYYLAYDWAGQTGETDAVARGFRRRNSGANHRDKFATTSETHAQTTAWVSPEPSVTPIEPSREPSEAAHPPKPRTRTDERGTRLPDDWQATAEQLAHAADAGLDPQATERKFRNHWHTKPGAAGRKLRWDRVWENWCDNEREWAAGRARPGGGGNGVGHGTRREGGTGAVASALRTAARRGIVL